LKLALASTDIWTLLARSAASACFSEIKESSEIGSLSGSSGGPVFWSDGERLGLLGFVKEALDVEPRPGEDTIDAGPRVKTLSSMRGYETFELCAEHALREWPKRREESL
jgi:hypothetical protein